ncbi:hypothetical protein [Pseudodesulfovibrio karagichevae]|uniref:Uncharacterized protein n=1 Tax=Pseudodesulfovibrio karagichevae TaxID=3239305 RepID=A0ABV4K2D5_9BACT
MNDLLKSDAFTRTRVDRFTGEPRRQWLEYADGVMEPVRKEGSLAKKSHGNKRSLDWWTVEKPLDWDPAEEGRKVSLNHDYGRPEPFVDQPPNAPRARPRTLLAMGAQAAKEAGVGTAQSAPQAAEDLKQWERDRGIDPNRSSDDAKRPPSSSRDAAAMDKAIRGRDAKESADWMNRIRNNPPWADKEKTPAQKVQGVTHPLGESVGNEMMSEFMKNSGSKILRILGRMEKVGPLMDVLTSPEDAW